jgi:hypothetical protein
MDTKLTNESNSQHRHNLNGSVLKSGETTPTTTTTSHPGIKINLGSLLTLIGIFLSSLFFLYMIYLNFPKLEEYVFVGMFCRGIFICRILSLILLFFFYDRIV